MRPPSLITLLHFYDDLVILMKTPKALYNDIDPATKLSCYTLEGTSLPHTGRLVLKKKCEAD